MTLIRRTNQVKTLNWKPSNDVKSIPAKAGRSARAVTAQMQLKTQQATHKACPATFSSRLCSRKAVS